MAPLHLRADGQSTRTSDVDAEVSIHERNDGSLAITATANGARGGTRTVGVILPPGTAAALLGRIADVRNERATLADAPAEG